MLQGSKKVAGAAAIVVSLALMATGCSNGGAPAQGGASDGKTTLRFTWWGNQGRADRTTKAIAAFEAAHPNVDVQTEFLDWTQYWDKLSTDIAGGNAPDVVQMSEAYQSSYTKKKVLADLTPYEGKQLKLDSLNPALVEGARVDTGLYAVPWSMNARSAQFSKDELDKAGVTLPEKWTWDDFAAIGKQIKQNTGKPASVDPGFWIENFETWLMQRGKSLYKPGALGFTEADLTEFWTQTQAWAKDGVVADAQTTSPMAAGGTDVGALVTKQTVFDFRWSSESVIFDKLGTQNIQVVQPPGEYPDAGVFQHPAMLLSVTAKSKNKELAAELVNFLVTSPEAAKELGMERGAPASSTAADTIKESLTPAEKGVVAYHEAIADHVHKTPLVVPAGGGEMLTTFTRLYEEVAFGRTSIADGAKQFTEAAQRVAES